MTAVFRSRATKRDLEDIWLTIALDNPNAATRVAKRIGEHIAMMAKHPRLGPRRPDIRSETRMLVEGRWLILYRTVPDADEGPIQRVEILRVIDGRRDLT